MEFFIRANIREIMWIPVKIVYHFILEHRFFK